MRSREDIERQLLCLEGMVTSLNQELADWSRAASELTHSLATERAKTQSAGRGLGGMLFGAKYRAAVRRGAASANANLSRQAAEKRAIINENKLLIRDKIQDTRAKIAACKAELRATGASKTSASALTALKKLKELHEMGVLTEAEFNEKREKLLGQI